MRSCFLCLMIILAVTTSAPRGALAQPRAFNYQGFVSELDGTPLQGTQVMTFRIYSGPTLSTPLWVETRTAVALVDGVFSVLLGSSTPLPDSLWEMEEVWIGVTVGNTGTEIIPRLQVTSVPWAIRAAVADSAVVAGSSGGSGVTQVDTGPGLEGGPITTTGTIGVAAGGIENSMLASNSVTGSKVQNETLTGSDLADDTVGADDLIDEPGVAFFTSTASTDVAPGSDLAYMAGSITVPRSGFIHASASVEVWISHSSGSQSTPRLSISTTTSMNWDHTAQWVVPPSDPSSTRIITLSWTQVFAVSQGAHTFRIVANMLTPTSIRITGADFTMLFVPTAYGDVATKSSNPEDQP